MQGVQIEPRWGKNRDQRSQARSRDRGGGNLRTIPICSGAEALHAKILEENLGSMAGAQGLGVQVYAASDGRTASDRWTRMALGQYEVNSPWISQKWMCFTEPGLVKTAVPGDRWQSSRDRWQQKDAGQQFLQLPNMSNSVIVADAACRRPRLHAT